MSQYIIKNLAFAKYPTNLPFDYKMYQYDQYIKTLIKTLLDAINLKPNPNNKNKGKEKEEAKKIKIYFSPNFSLEQKRVFEILSNSEYNENNQIQTDYKEMLKNEFKNNVQVLQFSSFIVKEVEKIGKEILQPELPFSEYDVLKDNIGLIKRMTNKEEVEIIEYKQEMKVKGLKSIIIPGKPFIVLE
jgi:hypothetical protein